MAYAVKRLVGPTWPYARLATLPSCSLPGRRPYWHGPAGSRWQSQSRAQAPSWRYALPDYLPHHAVCPVAVPTGTGLPVKTYLAVESSGSPAWPYAPLDLLPKHAACPDRRPYRLGPCAASTC